MKNMGKTKETMKNKLQTRTQTLKNLHIYVHKKLGQ
jgi:hypothetical protein